MFSGTPTFVSQTKISSSRVVFADRDQLVKVTNIKCTIFRTQRPIKRIAFE